MRLRRCKRCPAKPASRRLGSAHRYHRRRGLLASPWPERIYVTDPERRHGFATAAAEYRRLMETLPALRYDVIDLAKMSRRRGADFVLAQRGDGTPSGLIKPSPRRLAMRDALLDIELQDVAEAG